MQLPDAETGDDDETLFVDVFRSGKLSPSMPWGEETKACDESPDSVEVSLPRRYTAMRKGSSRAWSKSSQ